MKKAEHPEIPGLYIIDLDVFPDARGSFREAWQAEKLKALGLPEIHPVQWNLSVSKYGVIRGIHSEPWQKYAHPVHGTAFVVIVDLREELPSLGKTFTIELDESRALLIPKGAGHAYQATSEVTVYGYLTTEVWVPGTQYLSVAYDDPDLAVNWPIKPNEELLSPKDRENPKLYDLFPKKSR